MFKKTANEPRVHSLIARDVTINGSMRSSDDMRVDGKIYGEISCAGKIIIGESGYIEGNIESEEIEVYGRINGEIKSCKLLILRATAILEGKITTDHFEVEQGAKFLGSCQTSSQMPQTPQIPLLIEAEE